MPIFEFACADGHEFQLWQDEARLCPICGSEFLKRIFVTPPNVNTSRTNFVDNLIKNEFDKRGITNVKSDGKEGETNKVTYKSTPADLAAEKVKREFPQMNDPNAIQQMKNAVHAQWAQVGPKGVINSGIGKGQNAGLFPVGTTPDPRTGKLIANPTFTPNEFARNDKLMVNRRQIKDPENLTIKR